MAYVQTHEHGCVISRPDRNQQICLSLGEWRRLGALSGRITAFMGGACQDVEQGWSLSNPDCSQASPAEVRVTLSCYNSAPYCNIRMYTTGDQKPTKQGVTVNLAQWTSLSASLGEGDEVRAARETYEALLRELVLAGREKLCEGCREHWPSQKDHECLEVSGGRQLTQRVLSSKPPVNVCEFQYRLSETARDRGLALRMGMSELYGLCRTYFRADMEDSLMADSLPCTGL